MEVAMTLAALRTTLLLAALAAALPAQAVFHLWSFTEIFSSADGKVQFVELVAETGGQQFLAGHTLTASGGTAAPRTLTFGSNLPGDSGGHVFLVGTASFAALGVVQPDYVVPDGFFSVGGGSIDFAGVEDWNYPALPTDGRTSLLRNGSTAVNSPRNFAGATGVVQAPAADFNVQGLWWRSPAGSESGWGMNLVHQGTILFVTWFTYGLDGNQIWLVMSDARRTAPNTYAGAVYRTTGPAFNAEPFNPAQIVVTQVGTATLSFTDGDNGSFSYTVNGISQVKPITRQVFAFPVSTCTFLP
jgi:hypothetical protein